MKLLTKNHIQADKEIESYINLNNPTSFFLLAGAGSGKTRSLVQTLQHIDNLYSRDLACTGKQVAVITYTNAASDEIKERIKYNPLFHVSTIHSFAWLLIKNFPNDIRNQLKKIYINKKEKANGSKKERFQAKLEQLPSIEKFTYSPDSNISGHGFLNHNEVIEITATLLTESLLMPKLLVQQFPFVLIDECQDTNKKLMNSFLKIERETNLGLGLFGDMMQRIYHGGKEDLFEEIKVNNWKLPQKTLNWRSKSRIVQLINKIRNDYDGLEQEWVNEGGNLGIYIIPTSLQMQKSFIEDAIENDMLKTGVSDAKFNRLILEHHMASTRNGFDNFFSPLYCVPNYKERVLDGSLKEIRFLKNVILTLFNANQEQDDVSIANIVRKHSFALNKDVLKEKGAKQFDVIKEVNQKMKKFLLTFNEHEDDKEELTIKTVISNLKATNLFEIPEMLLVTDSDQGNAENYDAWLAALNAPFSELESYVRYTDKMIEVVTQQGSKGLEFTNVMLVLDDSSAKGNQFSFEKLFGVKKPTDIDKRNIKQGKDHSIARTGRLFYVGCSRAEENLCVVIYSENPEKVYRYMLERDYATKNELKIVDEEFLMGSWG